MTLLGLEKEQSVDGTVSSLVIVRKVSVKFYCRLPHLHIGKVRSSDSLVYKDFPFQGTTADPRNAAAGILFSSESMEIHSLVYMMLQRCYKVMEKK